MEHLWKVSWKNTIFLNVNEAGTHSYTALCSFEVTQDVIFSFLRNSKFYIHNMIHTKLNGILKLTDDTGPQARTGTINHTGAQLSQIQTTNKSGTPHSVKGTFTYT